MDFLAQMAERSRERVAAAKRECSQPEMFRRASDTPAPTRLQLSEAGFDLIAEIKLRSPAAGVLESKSDVGGRAAGYAKAGAAAVSVLTEPSRFDGSLQHLESATNALGPLHIPAMRKDFLVDPYQIAEARVAGAGGVLLILRMLPRGELKALLEAARQFDLFVLLEAFDAQDIELAHELTSSSSGRKDVLVGVNCRDLVTLQVVPKRLEQLASLLPTNVPRVAESGIESAEDARRARQAGYELALVGSALMRAKDPAAQVRQMLEAGRER